MDFSEQIKTLRQECLLSQEAFSKELGVSFATVNRWETGKTLPTYKALRTIKEYCKKNNVEFSIDTNIERGSTNG
ncbi:helix-turn-helix domain-containing protein [Faecalicatena acetigenes]|uniref:Helix-turn-helix domain-containing protein n=1 Tax=Faecalicatena acetigenes TaxID=2981790 RepID=A0ABT2T9D8_9FIRM|nr:MULTISPECIES: helix-turn-helix transcriptional regulator [Lachnospiraceae]MCU6746586.1 helix-turn-helix domain-containing protein [Faecalicatena acetigenes]RGT74438.1 XRE family transcriptional regulator [Ruminococcus sp. AF18-22]SCH30715.1 putative zinc finger/helix-turn-helix protein%2C YgiT family [uncultured Clostridium sp.]